MTTPEVYKKLPSALKRSCTQELGLEARILPTCHNFVLRFTDEFPSKRLGTSAEEYVAGFLKTSIARKEVEKTAIMEQLKVQMIWLEAPGRVTKVTSHTKQPRKRLSSRQKKKLKLYDIPKDQHKYSLYTPLHELWKQYMEDLLQIGSQKGSLGVSQMNQRVTKADLHGCLLRVQRSKCPSYIGTEGIVLQESQNTFKLITSGDRLKTVPKANSVFTFDLGGYCFCLYGNHLRFRAGERSARKFKDKQTVELC